ncbi:hypothetical protein CEV33_4231 [Brucella grignonensis]|uniref:Uncharacterized protein n=1 Tax=Brucella grignonensis TaxID=94627 RepID=A0A256FQG3_9HYPH|nr:hypothetical protein CEV33_4231 [Brucella grignonensis]
MPQDLAILLKTEIEEVSVPTMSSLLKQVLNIGSRILPKTF